MYSFDESKIASGFLIWIYDEEAMDDVQVDSEFICHKGGQQRECSFHDKSPMIDKNC